MNIFFLSFNPQQAARSHCDRHVVKMLLESTQLLWTAQHVVWGDRLDLTDAPTTLAGRKGYRPTHRNHPCAVWARATLENYKWLCALAAALAEEYHYRYPKAGLHACEKHVTWLTAHPPPIPVTGPFTMPALAMPDIYKISFNPVACYRAYYLGDKQERGLLNYTRREVPDWVNPLEPSR